MNTINQIFMLQDKMMCKQRIRIVIVRLLCLKTVLKHNFY